MGYVSILLKLLPIGLALGAGYYLLKNSKSIGEAVGSFTGKGLSDAFGGLTSGLNKGLVFDPFGGTLNPNTAGATSKGDPNVFIPNPQTPSENDGAWSSEFSNFTSRNIISPQFAKDYSFQPPATGGQLDVSETLEYISTPNYRDRQVSASNNFGGYGSAVNQRDALAREIEINATKFPEWFA
jgi:hypothetical protein